METRPAALTDSGTRSPSKRDCPLMASLGLMASVIPVTRTREQLFWVRSKSKTIQCCLHQQAHTDRRSVTAGQVSRPRPPHTASLSQSFRVRDSLSLLRFLSSAILVNLPLPGRGPVYSAEDEHLQAPRFQTLLQQELHSSHIPSSTPSSVVLVRGFHYLHMTVFTSSTGRKNRTTNPYLLVLHQPGAWRPGAVSAVTPRRMRCPETRGQRADTLHSICPTG